MINDLYIERSYVRQELQQSFTAIFEGYFQSTFITSVTSSQCFVI